MTNLINNPDGVYFVKRTKSSTQSTCIVNKNDIEKFDPVSLGMLAYKYADDLAEWLYLNRVKLEIVETVKEDGKYYHKGFSNYEFAIKVLEFLSLSAENKKKMLEELKNNILYLISKDNEHTIYSGNNKNKIKFLSGKLHMFSGFNDPNAKQALLNLKKEKENELKIINKSIALLEEE